MDLHNNMATMSCLMNDPYLVTVDVVSLFCLAWAFLLLTMCEEFQSLELLASKSAQL